MADFDEIWYATADIEPDDSHVTKTVFLNLTQWTAAMLKIAFWPQLINRLSDFSKILHEEAERHADKGHMRYACDR